VFENWVLRGLFGPKRVGVTGGWKKLHYEKLHKFYFSPDIIRMIKWMRMRLAGNVACMGHMRNICKILVGNLERKRPLGRPKRG
jgi:hypothetical protein